MNPTHNQWLGFLQKQGFEHKQAEKLAKYASQLIKSDLPVIFELEHLSKTLGIELALLSRMTGASTLFYRSFKIPKRKSGTRTIHTPYPKLSYVQLWIKENILDLLPVSEHAYAYIKGRSHIDNARKHIGSKELLKLDISNFFGHIDRDAIHKVFFDCGYSESISHALAGLCSYWGVLPQGAPTSPALSNLVLKNIDRELHLIASNSSLIYTRYADDICISGRAIPADIYNKVIQVIEHSGFPINKEKTRILNSKSRKVITGLVVSETTVRVPKKSRRDYRQQCYYLIQNGISQLDGSRFPLNPLYLDEVIGKGRYILNVEPDNSYVRASLGELAKLKWELLGK